MIDIFWHVMTTFIQLIVPSTAIYWMFDFIGSMLFNKR